MLKKSEQTSDFFELNTIKTKKKTYVEKRSIWFWEYGLFVIWYWLEEFTKSQEKKIFSELINICKKENCLFVQIESISYDNSKKDLLNTEKNNDKFFKKWYYKKFITPFTALVDLKKTNEEILENMKQKWRYNIKLAEKKWVRVYMAEKNDENIEKFYNLILETTNRNKFSWNTFKYYKTLLKTIDHSKLILAKKDEEIISGWIFIFDKEISIYYYWASTSKEKYRNIMSPYLVQWEAIKYAKSIGCKIYDLMWVSDPDSKNCKLKKVSDFKNKLTKDIRKVSGSKMYIHKKVKYFFIIFLRKIKNFI